MRFTDSLLFKLLLAMAIPTIILALGIGFFAYSGSSKLLVAQVEKNLASESLKLAANYESWVLLQHAQLESLAASTKIDYSDQMYARLADETRRLGYNSISPADSSGILHLAGGKTADLSKRPYLQKVLATGQPAVSDPVYSAVAGEENLLTVLFAVPVMEEGRLTKVLIGQRVAEFLNANISAVDYGEGSENFMVNREGVVIADTVPQNARDRINLLETARNDPAQAGRVPIVEAMTEAQNGVKAYRLNGELRYVGFAPVRGMDWSVGVDVPESAISAPLVQLRTSIFAVSLIAFLFGLGFALIAGIGFVRPIKALAAGFREVAEGDADLTRRLTARGKDELAETVTSFNAFAGSLQGIIQSLRSIQGSLGNIGESLSVNSVESASAIGQIMANIGSVRKHAGIQHDQAAEVRKAMADIAEGIRELDRLIETQVSGSTEMAASIEQMVGNIDSVANSTGKMTASFQALSSKVGDGRQKQKDSEENALGIARKSELLTDANNAISGIAAQTNLLAMNAAIEAAHAGNAGKGFSVVADEIRKLSEQASAQSKAINVQIAEIQKGIHTVVSAAKASTAVFGEVSAAVETTGGLVSEIEGAMSEQRSGSRQILEALREINEMSESVKRKAGTMTSSSELIRSSVEELNETATMIFNSMDEMTAGATQINESAQRVSELARETNESLQAMERQTDKFKV